MATVHYKVCDKCGKKIEYTGWTSKLKGKFRRKTRFTLLKLLNGNPDGYCCSEWDYELCADCTKKLEEFLVREDYK